MNVRVYKIVMAPVRYDELHKELREVGLESLSCASEQKAIDRLKSVFNQKGIKFKLRTEGNDKVFVDEAGTELARVVSQ